MAEKKWSEYTELSQAEGFADDDFSAFVDRSDTSQSPTGSNKRYALPRMAEYVAKKIYEKTFPLPLDESNDRVAVWNNDQQEVGYFSFAGFAYSIFKRIGDLADIGSGLASGDTLVVDDADAPTSPKSVTASSLAEWVFNRLDSLEAIGGSWAVDNPNDLMVIWDADRSQSYRATIANFMLRALRYFHERPEHTTISDGDRIPWFDDTDDSPVHALASTLAQYVHDYVGFTMPGESNKLSEGDTFAFFDVTDSVAYKANFGDLRRLMAGLTADTYTPNGFAVSNVDSATPYTSMYWDMGSQVLVAAKASVDVSSTGDFRFDLSLPVASSFTGAHEVIGICLGDNMGYSRVAQDATNDRLACQGNRFVGTGARDVFVLAVYKVLP